MIARTRDLDPIDPEQSDPEPPALSRLFLREPGWRIAQKVGSGKEYCHMIAPGHDYYHRLLDGEIYVYHGDEKLCLPCADRRGLFAKEPKQLLSTPMMIDATEPPYDLGPPPS